MATIIVIFATKKNHSPK